MIVNLQHIPKHRPASNYLWKAPTRFISHIPAQELVPASHTAQQESTVCDVGTNIPYTQGLW